MAFGAIFKYILNLVRKLGVDFLIKNYFESVCNVISANKKMEKFSINKLGEYVVEFVVDEAKYIMEYDTSKSLIKLFRCGENCVGEKDGESKVEIEQKIISSWLMEFEKCTSKDVNMIAADFIQEMVGKEKKLSSPNQARKKRTSDENNITGLFFANRMASVFPKIKEKIQEEKSLENDFRIASFTQMHVLPCIEGLLNSEKQKSEMNKLGKLLGDLYHNGGLDVRSVITMGIFCGLSDKSAIALRSLVSDELAKAFDAALKYKGKNVKPKKIRTKKSFLSKLLEAQERAG